MSQQAKDYLAERGIKDTGPEALNESLRRVLNGVEPMIYESPTSGLTGPEQAALVAAGLRLERTSGRDLVAESAVRFAAPGGTQSDRRAGRQEHRHDIKPGSAVDCHT